MAVSLSQGFLFPKVRVVNDELHLSVWDASSGSIYNTVVLKGKNTAAAGKVQPSISLFETVGLGRSESGERVAVVLPATATDSVASVAVVHVTSAKVEWTVSIAKEGSKNANGVATARTDATVKQLFLLDAETLIILLSDGSAYRAQRTPIPTKASRMQDLMDDNNDEDEMVKDPSGSSTSAKETIPQTSVVRWLADATKADKIVAIYPSSPDVAIVLFASGKLVSVGIVDEHVSTTATVGELTPAELSSGVIQLFGEPLLQENGGCAHIILTVNGRAVLVEVASGRSADLCDIENAEITNCEYFSEFGAVVATKVGGKKKGSDVAEELRYFTITMTGGAGSSGSPKKVKATEPLGVDVIDSPAVRFTNGQSIVATGYSNDIETHTIILDVDGSYVMGAASTEKGAPTQEAIDNATWSAINDHAVGTGKTAAVRFSYPYVTVHPVDGDGSVPVPAASISAENIAMYDVAARHEVQTRCSRRGGAARLLATAITDAANKKNGELESFAVSSWNPIVLRQAVRYLSAANAVVLFNSVATQLEAFATAAKSTTNNAVFLPSITAGVETAVQIVTLQHQMGLNLSAEKVNVLYAAVSAVRTLGKSWSAAGARLDSVARFEALNQTEKNEKEAVGEEEENNNNNKSEGAGLRAADASRLIRRENATFKSRYAVGGGSVATSVSSLINELPASLQDAGAVLGAKGTNQGRGWNAVSAKNVGTASRFAQYESHFHWDPK